MIFGHKWFNNHFYKHCSQEWNHWWIASWRTETAVHDKPYLISYILFLVCYFTLWGTGIVMSSSTIVSACGIWQTVDIHWWTSSINIDLPSSKMYSVACKNNFFLWPFLIFGLTNIGSKGTSIQNCLEYIIKCIHSIQLSRLELSCNIQ